MNLKPARLLLALLAVAAAPVFAQNLATVNGKAIPNALVEQVIAQSKQADSPQLRESIKNMLIGREVLIQEGARQGFGTRPELIAQVENARQSIMINAMLARHIKNNPVKDADIQAEYDKRKTAFGETEYHARHILVATEAEANDIIAKLKAGTKFEELAKLSKDSGSAANGGDLGWANPSSFVAPFSKAMVALKNGQITETPVKSEFGYHVIKLEETKAAKVPALEEVKDQLTQELQKKTVEAYFAKLMKKAKIQ
jgi:peptidyl-prolyl cis-trans isomerase C